MICKKCGCSYEADLSSCPKCGCPNDSVDSTSNVKDNSTVCPYCGAPIEGFKICQWCGTPLVEGVEHEKHEYVASDSFIPVEENIEHEKQESVLPDINNTAPSSSIDQNKKKGLNPWYILLPVGALLIAFICVIIVRNREDYRREEGAISTNSSRESTQYVYSGAYDGFVNIRATPSYSAPIIGEFRNGPEGAILLEREGDWFKIDVNGLVGFVPAKYLIKTPTVAYTGDISVDWLEGKWLSSISATGAVITFIFNNGDYVQANENGRTEMGRYMMQNKDEIAMHPVWIEDGADIAERSKVYILKITNRTEKEMCRLSEDGPGMWYRQIRFMTPEEVEEKYGDGIGTIDSFRSLGRNISKQLEEMIKQNTNP